MARGSDRIKLIDNSANVKGSMRKVQKDGLREAAKVIRAAAKARVPVRSGGLKKAIATWVRNDYQRDCVLLEVGVYNSKKQKQRAPHAHLIEFGSSRSEEKPFLRPAVENNIKLIRNVIEQGMEGIKDDPEYKDWLKKAKEEAVEDD